MDATTLNIQAVLPKTARPARPASTPAETGKPLPESGNTAPVRTPDLPDVEVPEIDIEQVVQQIETFLSETQRELQFKVHEASGRTIISVYSGSGELIRQIPSEELLELAAAMQEQGFNLIDRQV